MITRRGFFIGAASAAALLTEDAIDQLRHPGRRIFLPPRKGVLIPQVGRSGPYTYRWEWVTVEDGVLTIVSPNDLETAFVGHGRGTARVIATDSVGREVWTFPAVNR
jgi:hypothetical protein